MKAAVFHGVEEPLQIEDVEEPTAEEDQIIVETEACGICRSDWHAWKGDWSWIGVMPTDGLVFGHEPAGTVVEVGDNVERFREGDQVTVPFNLSDGTCHHCRNGRGNICEQVVPLGFLKMAPGAFAERFPVRKADHNAIKLPENVDPVDVAALGCRFATAFHGLAHRVDINPGDWVAVHGLGGVGLSAVHIAEALGANVIGIDIIDEKLDKAEELGADETLNANDVKDVPQAVKQFTESSRGVDISVDALGVAETCQNSVNSLGKGGQHLQIGLTTSEEGGNVSLPVDNIVMDERDFKGSFGMPPNQYQEIFRMMDRGKIDPGKIVTETVSLEEVPDVIESMGDYDTVGIPVCNEF
ncbi:zinc-dependent alcohol dehydrogenase family protein [Halorientalis brevis]|uniref:zinc-dependent alcohol dehydrogenase family protein n=1 Tax=Halorientalis brevis TaxID=1126241 RepID=UPI001FFA1A01|nr:zinc-dependent alcohol dehydrogenase family protein [Halorientalis brevis]